MEWPTDFAIPCNLSHEMVIHVKECSGQYKYCYFAIRTRSVNIKIYTQSLVGYKKIFRDCGLTKQAMEAFEKTASKIDNCKQDGNRIYCDLPPKDFICLFKMVFEARYDRV